MFILMLGHKSTIVSNLYLDTGAGDQMRVIDINKIQESVGSAIPSALSGLNALTGILLFLIKCNEFLKSENCISSLQ